MVQGWCPQSENHTWKHNQTLAVIKTWTSCCAWFHSFTQLVVHQFFFSNLCMISSHCNESLVKVKNKHQNKVNPIWKTTTVNTRWSYVPPLWEWLNIGFYFWLLTMRLCHTCLSHFFLWIAACLTPLILPKTVENDGKSKVTLGYSSEDFESKFSMKWADFFTKMLWKTSLFYKTVLQNILVCFVLDWKAVCLTVVVNLCPFFECAFSWRLPVSIEIYSKFYPSGQTFLKKDL